MELKLTPIGEHSYSFMEGFTLRKEPHKDGMRQIDWETVKKIIDSKEFDTIEVGLDEDYYQTHAEIFDNGKINIIENDGAGFYGASYWATPAVKLFKNGHEELFECWILGEETGFPEWLKEAHND